MTNNHKQYWQQLAETYHRNIGEQGDIRHQHVINPIVFEMLGDLHGMVVLDAACGNGYLSRKMAETAEKVVGIDFTETLIQKAIDQTNPQNIEFLIGNLEQLHFADTIFDVVLCNMALMDMEHMPLVIRELSRVLKQKGVLVISITHPCFENPSRTYSLFENEKRIGRVVQRYFDTGLVVDAEKVDTPGLHYQHYHYTISDYLNAFSQTKLRLVKTIEPNGNELIGGEGGNDHTPTFMLFKLERD
jgi:ubiquinone/menaquinone biosynthesis C-methylase UbiE